MASLLRVMVLAVGMAVSGDMPGTVPVETERGLDLHGEWEGTMDWLGRQSLPVVFAKGILTAPERGIVLWPSDEVFDEGQGRFLLTRGAVPKLGIYRYQGDSLCICFGWTRPVAFSTENGGSLIVLHRVKPAK
jgi:hypothetical protein